MVSVPFEFVLCVGPVNDEQETSAKECVNAKRELELTCAASPCKVCCSKSMFFC